MKDLTDNKNGVPLKHYQALFAQGDPRAMSARSGVPYEDGQFTTVLLGHEVTLSYPDMALRVSGSGKELGPGPRILLARLLTGGALAQGTGKLRSYAELPWGNVYLNQFKGRCLSRLAFGFGGDPAKLEAACTALGGVPVPGSGQSYDLFFLPTLQLRLTVWPGEEEFPPAAQILFSDNFPLAFSAEDMAVCGDVVLDALKGRLF